MKMGNEINDHVQRHLTFKDENLTLKIQMKELKKQVEQDLDI